MYKVHKRMKVVEILPQKSEKRQKSYPHQKLWKYRKNWVIHGVIHVIHEKKGENIGSYSKKCKQMFCEHIIKLLTWEKRTGKVLTFQMWKTIKKWHKMSVNFENGNILHAN